MNDIIKQLVEQLNLDEEVAQEAVNIVIGAVKDKLPAPISDQLDGLLEGGDPADLLAQLGGGNAGGIIGMIMSLLGIGNKN